MPKLMLAAVAALALAAAGPAGAALVPKVFDPGSTHCPKAVFANGVLHLEKNCATTTNASTAGLADIYSLFSGVTLTAAATAMKQGICP